MTLKEMYETNIGLARDKLQKLEAELAALPAEFHALELDVWERIKAFFHV